MHSKTFQLPLYTQYINWRYLKHSEDIQDVFRTFSERLIYVQFLSCVQGVNSKQLILVYFSYFCPQTKYCKQLGFSVSYTLWCLIECYEGFYPISAQCSISIPSETKGFLTFSRGIEIEHWAKMVQRLP